MVDYSLLFVYLGKVKYILHHAFHLGVDVLFLFQGQAFHWSTVHNLASTQSHGACSSHKQRFGSSKQELDRDELHHGFVHALGDVVVQISSCGMKSGLVAPPEGLQKQNV